MSKPFTPRSYQTLSTNYILDNPRCAIWGFMGAGKTASGLQAIDILNLSEPGPTLVVAPLRVARSVWSDEIAKWQCFGNLSLSRVIGNPDERSTALRRKADIYTTNFEQLPWLTTRLFNDWPFTKVFIDESTKLKSWRGSEMMSKNGVKFVRGAGAMRARGLAKLAHTKIRRLIEFTGTPAPAGLQDLWGQTWFIDAGKRLGNTFDSFTQRWFRPNFNGFGVEPLKNAQTDIEQRLNDICMSLKSEDYFDIEKPIVTTLKFKLPPKAWKLYRDMERELFIELKKGNVEALNAAGRVNKCQQIASGCVYTDDQRHWEEIHNEKIDILRSIIEEAAGMPVLVAYHFNFDLERLQKAFPYARVLDNKDSTIKQWNAGKIQLLLSHPQSAGHGLSLQDGGNILVYFGINWPTEPHDQILERIGPVRQLQSGHKRSVFVYYIIAEDTVDEDIIVRQATHRSVQEILKDAMRSRG